MILYYSQKIMQSHGVFKESVNECLQSQFRLYIYNLINNQKPLKK
jgi:hypothetical protein